MRLRAERRTLCALAVGLALCGPAHGAKGLRVYHIGNSLTDQCYGMHSIAIGKGYTDVLCGQFMIPGAPINYLWDHQSAGAGQPLLPMGEQGWQQLKTTVSAYLASTSIDAITLQLFPQNNDNAQTMADAGSKFAEAAYKGNPNCQVCVFGSYPSGGANYATEIPRLNAIAIQGAAGISAKFPNRKPVLVIPVMQAFEKLGGNSLINDGIHADSKGKYVEALTFFTTIYKVDPRGAVTSGLYFWSGPYSVDQGFAANAQSTVFDIVKNYPQAGFNNTAVSDRGAVMSVRTASAFAGRPAGLLDLQGRLVSALTNNPPNSQGMFCTSTGEVRSLVPQTLRH